MQLNIQDSFNRELPADPERQNSQRQVYEACFSYVTPRVPTKPALLHVADEMLETIGLNQEEASSPDFLATFSGAAVRPGTDPYAMAYGGHQFGHWAGQLGDGRAINLMEVKNKGQRWALQLKGAGETPYSRSADGLAVLRSSIREHLCSEAMHYLGVPTTRSLSLALTGDMVLRDMLYNGNAAYEKGAVVCRVAPSFIRFGSFQLFAKRNDVKTLKQLADYTIRHFFPAIQVEGKDRYVQFFQTVADRTMEMVIHWQRVGFVHGVMNTDNLSILGLTIDYGPYGWLEGYDPDWTPNTTDSGSRRYRFGQQAGIALWNLAQLGRSLLPLVEEVEPLQAVIENFKEKYGGRQLSMMRQKLGLVTAQAEDEELVGALVATLRLTETDMTIFFRRLADFRPDSLTLKAGEAIFQPVMDAFYTPEEVKGEILAAWTQWFTAYAERLRSESGTEADRRLRMQAVNPKYVLRNYMAQLAIDQADTGNYELIGELYELLKRPYEEQPAMSRWFAKRPEWARNKVGCSMLSCSS